MTLSEELKKVYASNSSDVILHTLEFNHSTFPSPFYIVRDYQDFQANLENSGPLVTFQKYAFSVTAPKIDANGVQDLKITVDNVGKDITDLLEGAQADTGVSLTVVYRIYLASDTSGPQNDPPQRFILSSVSADSKSVSGSARALGLINKRFPKVDYGPVFKSLFISTNQ